MARLVMKKLRPTSAATMLAYVMVCAVMLSTSASMGTPADTSVGQSITLLPDGSWLRLGGVVNGRVSAQAVIIDQQGTERPLEWRIREARAGHTATVLPDGRVLVVGGVTSSGGLSQSLELIDPSVGVVEQIPAPDTLQRAYHTTTLLLNGSLLLVGGQSVGGTLADSGIWALEQRTFTSWNIPALDRRAHHSAMLDVGVFVTGGTGRDGQELHRAQRYGVTTGSLDDDADAEPAGPTDLAASLPANGERDIPTDTRIALRFSAPIALGSLSTAGITLSGPSGATTRGVVAAEAGRLVFVSPSAPLETSAAYQLSLSGIMDLSGTPLPDRVVSFITASERLPDVPDGDDDGGSGVDSSWRTLPPLTAAPGVTALAGQVLRLNGEPLPGVTLRIDDTSTRSDRTGRFLLSGLNAGHRVLHIEGDSASRPDRAYGRFEAGVEVLSRRTSSLPYTIWMTRLDTANAVQIPSPTTADTVVTTPRLPGLELRIPAGTVIRDDDGRAVTEITITPVPIDRPPFPLPAGVTVPIYFTIQPGGAYLQNPSGSQARLIYPNSFNQPLGTVFDFWNYNADGAGWYVYGQGAVAPGGQQIVPNPGVGIYEFSGAMVANPNLGPPTGPPAPGGAPGPPPPSNDPPGGGPPDGPGAPPPDGGGGDPVDLATGLFVYTKTDVSLADSWPLALQRAYRPGDSQSRPFGVGSTHDYELLLLGDVNLYTFMDLILPSGARVHYPRTSSGTSYADAVFEHTATPTVYFQSKITWNGTSWDLRLKNGMIYTFPNSFLQSSPAKAALVGMRDRLGNKVSLIRNASGDLMQLVSPHGQTLTFIYDTSHRITSATDTIGRVTQYAYDASGRLTTVTDPDSQTTQYTYDSSNRMLTIRDRRGILFLTNTYDTAGRVSLQTLQDSTTYQFAYTVDGGGHITQTDVTDPAGLVRRVAFNASGYMTSDTRALGLAEQQATTYVRNASTNLITSSTDALGRQTTYTYDTAGNRTSITNLAGTGGAATTTFTYDATFNFMMSITDPLTHTTTLAYDTLGQLVTVTDPLTHQWTFTNSATGLLLATTDPLLHITTFAYEGGSLTGVTDALGNASTRFLDSVGRPVSLIDPLGRTTHLAYDALDRATSTTDAVGNVIGLGFDNNGNVLSVTDPQNHAVTYVYDQMDRVQTRTDPLSNQDASLFDANGRLHQVTDRKSQITTYAYDGLNRRTGVTFADASTIAYTYDAGNRLTQLVDSVNGTITRTYNGLDQITDETTPQGEISYIYNVAGRRTSMTVVGQTAVAYSYDDANRLTSITRGTTVVGFAYDAANRRISTTYPNGVVATYIYDVTDRLTTITFMNGATPIGDLEYAYDAAGNRTSVGGSLADTVLPTAVGSATYDAANRLTQWGAATLTSDLAGNMTSDGANSFTWNARNQLDSVNGGAMATFAYDPLGRRSARTVNSTQTQYLYDGLNSVQELDGSGPTANLMTGLGVDETFVRSDGSGTLSLLADALGSILALTDGSGSIATQYTYGAFGQVSVTGTATANGSEFTGRDNDGTGLYSYRARYYSPALNRFIGDDPIGLFGGINATSYVGNNPVRFVDPFGLYPQNPNDSTGPPECNLACKRFSGVENITASARGPELYVGFIVASAAAAAIVETAAGRIPLRGNIKLDPPGTHAFPWGSKEGHIQINLWLQGVPGSDVRIRIPIPGWR